MLGINVFANLCREPLLCLVCLLVLKEIRNQMINHYLLTKYLLVVQIQDGKAIGVHIDHLIIGV